MEKIMFALDIKDGWPPVSSEAVWCEKVGDKYQFKNIPFFVSGIAFNDIFSAVLDPVNEHVFEFEIVKNSGHSVVWFINNEDLDTSKFKDKLIEFGCSIEGFPKFSLGAIDVPPSVNFDALEDLIELYENKGLDFAFPVWRKRDN